MVVSSDDVSRPRIPSATSGNSESAEILGALLDQRWSCRAFLPRPVERGLIERIVALAARSGSWCNTQPWDLIITEGAETERFREGLMKAALSEENAGRELPEPIYEGVYLERRRETGWRLYDAVGVKRGDREGSSRQAYENFRLFGAPHVAILTVPKALGPYGILDIGGFIQLFLLAAQSHGVATIAQAAIAARAVFVREFFDIPEDRIILGGISFGYADEAHPANAFRTSRAPLEELITWRGGPSE